MTRINVSCASLPLITVIAFILNTHLVESFEFNLHDSYLQTALSTEFPDVEVDTFRVKKRVAGRSVNIVSVPLGDVPIDSTLEAIRSVVNDINDRSEFIDVEYVDPSRYLSIMSLTKMDADRFFDDSVTIYVGTKDELIAMLRKAGDDAFRRMGQAAMNAPEGNTCFFLSYSHRDGRYNIGKTLVFVEYSSSNRLVSCLYEEVMQSFGLPGDLIAGSYSIFNDDGVYSYPTELDWGIWRLHHDPAVRAGMTKSEVADAIDAILAEGEPYD